MGIWRRGVVVRKTCGRKRVIKMPATTNRRGRSLEKKLWQLHKIISGGGAAGEIVDTEALFERLALHIYLLESRVKLLQSAYALFGPQDN